MNSKVKTSKGRNRENKRIKEEKLLILDIILKIFMIQRRAITDPLFGTLEYMQYLDYGLQLQSKQNDFLIRKGFGIRGKPSQNRNFVKTEPKIPISKILERFTV